MTYIPYSPEVGAKYTLTGPDGTVAVFNDPSDPNYVGMLTDVTGLDSSNVREAGDDYVATDGGWHGNFFYGRRPITMSGTVFGYGGSDERTARLDRLRRASNAMRADALLSWTNMGMNVAHMCAFVRRQQPLRITGAWVKQFQLQLVSADAPLYSYDIHTVENVNYYPGGDFENTNTAFGFPADWAATGGTLTWENIIIFSGNHSAKITATGGAPVVLYRATNAPWLTTLGDNIVMSHSVPLLFSFRAVALSTGRQWQCKVTWYNNAGTLLSTSTGAATASDAGGWQTATLTATPPAGAYTYRLQATTTTSCGAGEIHYVDDMSVQHATPGVPVVPVENVGDAVSWPWISLYGPLSNTGNVVTVTNTATGGKVQFLPTFTVAGGHLAYLDTKNHTLVDYLYDGTYVADITGQIDFVNTTWPGVVSGTNIFTGSLVGGGGGVADWVGAKIDWRDAWT